jgi:hypothetical protein
MTPGLLSYARLASTRRPPAKLSTKNVSRTSQMPLQPKFTPTCGALRLFKQSEAVSTMSHSQTTTRGTRRSIYSRPKTKPYKHTKDLQTGLKRNMEFASSDSDRTGEASTPAMSSQSFCRAKAPSATSRLTTHHMSPLLQWTRQSKGEYEEEHEGYDEEGKHIPVHLPGVEQ